MTDVLPDAVLVAAVYWLMQLCKPVLARFFPPEASWSNNAVRAYGFVLMYCLVALNWYVGHPAMKPADLWGLLPVAGALYGTSALLFHIQDDVLGAAPSVAIPPTAPQPPVDALPPTASPLGPSQPAPQTGAGVGAVGRATLVEPQTPSGPTASPS